MMLQEVKRMSGPDTWRVSRKKMYAFCNPKAAQKSKKEKQFGTLCTSQHRNSRTLQATSNPI